MKTHAIIDQFKFYRIPAGRQLAALRQSLVQAQKTRGAEKLVLFLTAAIAADEALFDMEMRWRGRKPHRVEHGEKAVALDREIDQLLGGIFDALSSQQRFSSINPERAESARRMTQELFPDGLGSVTRLGFADQSNAVFRIIDRVDDEPEFQKLAQDAGFAAGLDALRSLSQEYAREVNAHRPLDLDELQRERRSSNERLGSAVARIFGLFPDENPKDKAARALLMEPIFSQNEQVRLLRRRHRPKGAAPADPQIDDDERFDIDPDAEVA